jgi:hypothetical protein
LMKWKLASAMLACWGIVIKLQNGVKMKLLLSSRWYWRQTDNPPVTIS